jgi:hypothetical protein
MIDFLYQQPDIHPLCSFCMWSMKADSDHSIWYSDVVPSYNIKQAIPEEQRENAVKPGQSQFATPFL